MIEAVWREKKDQNPHVNITHCELLVCVKKKSIKIKDVGEIGTSAFELSSLWYDRSVLSFDLLSSKAPQ